MVEVLIADDSELVRRRLSNMISEVAGVQVVGEAADGPETLEAVERLAPDVVILDVFMPGGNGIDALRVLKAEDPSPVVIMLTVYAHPQYRERSMEAGAEHFLDKATEFERIVEILEGLVCAGAT